MSTYNRVVAADENASLAPTVRARLATEMADPTSDVGASLSGAFAAEVSEDFSLYPDGAVTETINKRPYIVHAAATGGDSNATDRTPRVVSSRLTYADTADLGGYVSVALDGPVTRIGAAFTFTPYSVSGGEVVLAAMSSPIGSDPSALYPGPIHFRIGPTSFSVDVFVTEGAGATTISTGTFPTPLTADDATVHEVEITLDRDAGYALIKLPDGTLFKSTQSDYFKAAAAYPFWELYRTATPTGKTLGKFVRIWADSRDLSAANIPQAIDKASRPSYISTTTPTSAQAFTTSNIQVPAIRPIARVASGQRFLIDVNAHIDITTDSTDFRFNVLNDAGSILMHQGIATKVSHSGRVAVRFVYNTTQKPGEIIAFRLGIQVVGAGAGTLMGSTPYPVHTIVMAVTPY